MGWECGMHGRENECGIVDGKPEGERRFGRLDAGRKMILKLVLQK
jgi:hypothetical protein